MGDDQLGRTRAQEYLQAKAAQGLGASSSSLSSLKAQLIKSHSLRQGPNVSIFFKQDLGLLATKGQGCYMMEPDNSVAYLDCANNVAGVGHSHPKVVEAGINALKEIQTNARFLHPVRERYVKRLLSTFPGKDGDWVLYMVNSGSEANDLALRMAKEYSTSPNPDHVICLDGAYHGHTQSIVDISPYKWRQCIKKDAANYHKEHVHIVSLPDTFRGPYRGPDAGDQYAKEVSDIVDWTGGVGAFIAESIMGCGGQIVMPDGYLQAAYDKVRAHGGVCIADEVQTGFARNGEHFWQFQAYGVTPDIVTMGKPMGNGYPMGGVAVRREVADAFAASGIEYFNTYGGNSVACSIGEAVLDAIEEDALQQNALRVGRHMREALLSLRAKHGQWVGSVRGQGLFQGVEFVRAPTGTQGEDIIPHADLAKFVVDSLMYERVITSRDGPDGSVLKIKPPLCFSEANVNQLVDAIDRTLMAAKDIGGF